jgi:hypothetical protein
MQGEKYMRFANIGLFIPFTLLYSIEDYYSSLHFVWFFIFISCIEFKFQLFILASNLVLSVVVCFAIQL